MSCRDHHPRKCECLETKVAELVQQVSDITSMWTEQCARTREVSERVSQLEAAAKAVLSEYSDNRVNPCALAYLEGVLYDGKDTRQVPEAAKRGIEQAERGELKSQRDTALRNYETLRIENAQHVERMTQLENALFSARDELGSATNDKASRFKVFEWCNIALETEDSTFKRSIMQSQLTSRDNSTQETCKHGAGFVGFGSDCKVCSPTPTAQNPSVREALWALLDDISTAGDMFKSDDKGFRAYALKKVEERSKYADSDGYKLTWKASNGVQDE